MSDEVELDSLSDRGPDASKQSRGQGTWPPGNSTQFCPGALVLDIANGSALIVRLLFLWTLMCPFAARGEILSVAPRDALFKDVRSAVLAAKEGDTVRVQTGVYEGDLVLDKR